VAGAVTWVNAIVPEGYQIGMEREERAVIASQSFRVSGQAIPT